MKVRMKPNVQRWKTSLFALTGVALFILLAFVLTSCSGTGGREEPGDTKPERTQGGRLTKETAGAGGEESSGRGKVRETQVPPKGKEGVSPRGEAEPGAVFSPDYVLAVPEALYREGGAYFYNYRFEKIGYVPHFGVPSPVLMKSDEAMLVFHSGTGQARLFHPGRRMWLEKDTYSIDFLRLDNGNFLHTFQNETTNRAGSCLRDGQGGLIAGLPDGKAFSVGNHIWIAPGEISYGEESYYLAEEKIREFRIYDGTGKFVRDLDISSYGWIVQNHQQEYGGEPVNVFAFSGGGSYPGNRSIIFSGRGEIRLDSGNFPEDFRASFTAEAGMPPEAYTWKFADPYGNSGGKMVSFSLHRGEDAFCGVYDFSNNHLLALESSEGFYSLARLEEGGKDYYILFSPYESEGGHVLYNETEGVARLLSPDESRYCSEAFYYSMHGEGSSLKYIPYLQEDGSFLIDNICTGESTVIPPFEGIDPVLLKEADFRMEYYDDGVGLLKDMNYGEYEFFVYNGEIVEAGSGAYYKRRGYDDIPTETSFVHLYRPPLEGKGWQRSERDNAEEENLYYFIPEEGPPRLYYKTKEWAMPFEGFLFIERGNYGIFQDREGRQLLKCLMCGIEE